MRPRLALTTGEPAGIGPEITLAALAPPLAAEVTLIGDRGLLAERGGGRTIERAGAVLIEHVPLATPAQPGRLDLRNSGYVLRTLDIAIDGCRSGRFDAIVTAPVQKSIINEAGVAFSGHTEYLAEHTGTPRVVMMLVGTTARGPLRVALATTHLPLGRVSGALTIAGLTDTQRILDQELRRRFGILHPRIAVTGLNPHAGEAGHLGREEIDVIAPSIERARNEGIDAFGPLPADTLFVPDNLNQYDAVLAMFHDQGLPVLKYATFGHGVNVTLGLPFVRTSVDHGTALDIAGTGRAQPGSLRAALELAIDLAAKSRG
jgi:4-hydroxythreonine-4-phosphate dehydrogenase